MRKKEEEEGGRAIEFDPSPKDWNILRGFVMKEGIKEWGRRGK